MKLAKWLFVAVISVLMASSVTAFAADSVEMGPLDRVLGKADAPLTIIEYASMTCPHCARFHESIFPLIKSDWIEPGKVKLIYRDLPTNPVSMALGVAVITQCAPKEQYFPILGALFKSQDKWMGAQDPLSEIKRTVGLAGITPGEVDECLKNKEMTQKLRDRADEGTRLYNVHSTPTLVVDGQTYEGEVPYTTIKKALEDAYAKAIKK